MVDIKKPQFRVACPPPDDICKECKIKLRHITGEERQQEVDEGRLGSRYGLAMCDSCGVRYAWLDLRYGQDQKLC